jgi:Lrp/AsnC family transcriptional regulator, leucine-responsive regulatory protein
MQKVTKELISLDSKDQKILAELFKNGRAHYSTIAKNAHISKDIVNYRINKLIESGVMTNVSTIIDIRKLGWSSAAVFFKIRNLDKAKIKQFINYLIQSPFVVEILELAGGWDFAVRFYHKDAPHLNQLISNIESKFVSLIDNYSIFFISENLPLPYNALFENYKFSFPKTRNVPYKVNKLDLKILSALSYHGRTPLAQLQKELKENRMTIYNRINKMLKAGVIHSFRPNLFTEKLGFHWYEINLKLNNRSQVKYIIDQLKNITQVHLITIGFGLADLVFYIQVKHVQELQSILYMIREKFSKDIKSVESASVIKDHKWDFFPKGFLEEFS